MSTSLSMRWFLTRWANFFIQNRVIWLRMTPLYGTGSFMMTSKADMRSVVTMSRVESSIS